MGSSLYCLAAVIHDNWTKKTEKYGQTEIGWNVPKDRNVIELGLHCKLGL